MMMMMTMTPMKCLCCAIRAERVTPSTQVYCRVTYTDYGRFSADWTTIRAAAETISWRRSNTPPRSPRTFTSSKSGLYASSGPFVYYFRIYYHSYSGYNQSINQSAWTCYGAPHPKLWGARNTVKIQQHNSVTISGVARICHKEGQTWKLCHGAVTVDFRAGCSSCSMTNSFVTNAVLIERAVSCWHLHQVILQSTKYLYSWLSEIYSKVN